MFLSFSVTGLLVRPFTQLLQTLSKQGEGLFFEPHSNLLQLRVVNSTRSTHMLVNVDVSQLEAYRFATQGTTTSIEGHLLHSDNNNSNSEDFHLLLSTKALIATVLRQSQSLCAMHIRYDAASAADVTSCDTLYWECVLSCGIVRKFALPLSDGQPERASFSLNQFSFDACATAKVWGSLLAWFPASRPRVVVQPLNSRLEVRVVNDEELIMMQNGPQPADCSKGGSGCGEGETKVVATQDHFLFMVQHGQEMQMCQDDGGAKLLRATVKQQGALLPGKMIEVRPFKQVCLLADQLGMMIRVRTGGEGVPVFLEAITAQEARQAAAAVATNSSAPAGDCTATAALTSFGKSLSLLESSFRVKFTMYIAAFDVLQRSMENAADGLTATERYSTNSVTTVPGDDRGLISTNATHEPHGTSLATLCAVSFPSEGALLSATAPPTVHVISTENASVVAAGQLADFAGVSASVFEGASPPSRVLATASLTQGDPSRASVGASAVTASPSHYGGQSPFFWAAGDSGMVVKATPEVGGGCGGGVTNLIGCKRSRGDEGDHGHSPIQQSCVSSCCGVVTPSLSFVAPTALDLSAERLRCVQQQHQRHASLDGVQPSLETRYPLDFGAFMREIAEETVGDGDGDEMDEDLQRFLESCMSVVVLPTTPEETDSQGHHF